MKKERAGLTEAQAAEVRLFCEQNAIKVSDRVLPEGGSCILGNCVAAWVVPKGCRKPKRAPIFRNHWTQGEQPGALQLMLEMAKRRFPQYAKHLWYDCGVMD